MYESCLHNLGTPNTRSSSWRRRHSHRISITLRLNIAPGTVVISGVCGAVDVSVGAPGGGLGRGGRGSCDVHGIVFWRTRHLDSRSENWHGSRGHRVVVARSLDQGVVPVWVPLHNLGHLQSQRHLKVSMGPGSTMGKWARDKRHGAQHRLVIDGKSVHIGSRGEQLSKPAGHLDEVVGAGIASYYTPHRSPRTGVRGGLNFVQMRGRWIVATSGLVVAALVSLSRVCERAARPALPAVYQARA